MSTQAMVVVVASDSLFLVLAWAEEDPVAVPLASSPLA